MNAIRHLIYRSTLTRPATAAQIDALLEDARAFNRQVGVSGVLLFDGSQFFQIFEGTHQATDEVYERIRKSSMHADIVELSDGTAPKREFDRWYMGFCHAPESWLQRLEDLNWQQLFYGKRATGQRSEALDQLDAFLESAQSGAATGTATMST